MLKETFLKTLEHDNLRRWWLGNKVGEISLASLHPFHKKSPSLFTESSDYNTDKSQYPLLVSFTYSLQKWWRNKGIRFYLYLAAFNRGTMNHQLHFRREYLKCKHQGATSDTSNFNQGRRCYFLKTFSKLCWDKRSVAWHDCFWALPQGLLRLKFFKVSFGINRNSKYRIKSTTKSLKCF